MEFDDGARVFDSGDGVLIPGGIEHRHRVRVFSDAVKVIFVEYVRRCTRIAVTGRAAP